MSRLKKVGGPKFLGWVSCALGATEILVAKRLDRLLGTGDGENSGVFRVLGIRELMHGFDLLTHKQKKTGIRARIAGDLLDGLLLAIAARNSKTPSRVLIAAAAISPVVVMDLVGATRLSKRR